MRPFTNKNKISRGKGVIMCVCVGGGGGGGANLTNFNRLLAVKSCWKLSRVQVEVTLSIQERG